MSVTSDPRILSLRPVNPATGLRAYYPLNSLTTTVGRHPSNRVHVPVESISRFHARIERQGEEFVLTDLHSSNGTYIDGERIQSKPLAANQRIAFGNIEFRCELVDPRVESTGWPLETPVQLVGSDRKNSRPILQAEAGRREARALDKITELPQSEELAKAYRRLATLYKLGDILRSAVDEQQVLEAFMGILFEVLPADRGVILLREDPESDIQIRVARTREPRLEKPIALSRTIIDRCMEERVAILSQDAMSDQRFQASESVLLHDIRSTVVAPLIAHNEILGVLHLDTQESVHAFNNDDLSFVTSLADDLALFLSHRRIVDENQRSEEMAAVGEVITDLAHNIKNILLLAEGGIKLMDRLIADGDLERIQQNWGLQQKTLTRISTLVKEILDYSRAPQFRQAPANLNSVVHETCQSFRHEFEDKGIAVKLRLDKRIEETSIDAAGLERCLINLLVNACEAIQREDGEILVTTALRPNRDLVLSVEDNGQGISATQLPHIFFPRFSTKGEGTGLGMAMVKKWVTSIGGSIRVHSTVGEGTRFVITLPGDPVCATTEVDR